MTLDNVTRDHMTRDRVTRDHAPRGHVKRGQVTGDLGSVGRKLLNHAINGHVSYDMVT